MAAAALVAACGGGSAGSPSTSTSAGTSTPASGTGTGTSTPTSAGASTPTSSAALTISGKPLTQDMEGSQYTFTPTVANTGGKTLTFSVANLPSWATFDSSSGEISGTPSSGDIGTYQGIKISVSDGQTTASLSSFTIDVVATATGSMTLSLTAPTQYTDGSPLTDLAGYKIYWGTSKGNYTHSVTLNNPGLATYVVDQLTPATWYFVATAFDSNGVESPFSNVVSKTIN